ncbi:urease accessory protein UreD [Streptomyces sp. NBC_00344]|uniref:urease accessory protein UreD n=1 Tax=Streptomyces sp. NBC_00344 TaxID=2975720 RepID=UPI002E1A7DC3
MSIRATARVVAAPDGRGGTALPVLESDGPLALRRTRGSGTAAGVTVVGAMSAPLNGDRLAVEAEVRPGARLRLGSAAATIALPGHGDEPARYDIRITVGEDAELCWLPEQLICVRGSRLRMTTRIDLAEGARLVFREEQVLGRHGEAPGTLGTRLTVRHGGRPLLDQELGFGPRAAGGWDGGAVLAGYRAVGQLLVAEPGFVEKKPLPRLLGETAALTPLAGPAVLVTALAADAMGLRALLDEAVNSEGW